VAGFVRLAAQCLKVATAIQAAEKPSGMAVWWSRGE